MQVHKDIQALPVFKNAVVTIGTFDGVHRGHSQIINQLVEEAKKIDGESVIITFHPHPRKIVGQDNSPVLLLNTPEEKNELLVIQGIDHVVVVPFTSEFADQSAADYVENFLIKYFRPHTLIIGYDHRFGKGRTGDFQLLEEYSLKLGFKLIEIPQHLLHESAISSTRIRHNLLSGNITAANELLGYRYFFSGKVDEGNKLGRTIGYPTANLGIQDMEKLVPCYGVYAVIARLMDSASDQQPLKGMMNIGVRPTIDGTKRVIEVHLFDFNKNIYGAIVRVTLIDYLRAEQKFNGIDSLKQQLDTDASDALKVLHSVY
ncbi:MAG: bifunctional riboflavin kinase/FAD synthetase [Chitinophagaceae bacterium]